MKNILKTMTMVLASCMLLGSCATQKDQSAKKEALAMKVTAALDAREFKIDIDRMIPLSGPSKHVFDYFVELRNDSLISYLPYIGRAYNIPYGGGDGLNFAAPIGSYNESFKKNGQRHIVIQLKNKEDSYTYTFDIFDNGRSSIDVQSRQREPISYYGEMDTD